MSGVQAVLAHLDRVALDAGARSAEIEAARALPRDLVEALIGGGVFRLAVPDELSGFGADHGTVLDAIERCARRDGSTGLVVAAGILGAIDAERLPRHHAGTILGDTRTVIGGSRSLGGTGRLTDDGDLVVSGRWAWGTGVTNCTWIGGGVRLADDGTDDPSTGPGKATTTDAERGSGGQTPTGERSAGDERSSVYAYFRRDQVVVLDTWHAVGLRGSGSTDYQVTEAFVPEGRWLPLTDDHEPADGSAMDHLAPAALAAVAVGLAARAVDEVAALAPIAADGRSGPFGLGEAAQTELGRIEADVAGARSHLLAVAGDGRGVGSDGPEPLVAAIRIVDHAVDAVWRCFRLGGPAAVLHASPLQRLLRDAATIGQHPLLERRHLADAGRRRLGPG
ncbi:MAG: acyl-CoA dehydrogenase family protein [Actinomycetota bacterium]